jgi:PPP family 3-phenylpropionic acid transporter
MIPHRLAAYYGATFLAMGIHLPFWQVWLDSKGLNAEQIGIILATGSILKVIANPTVAQIADKYGERKRLIVLLTVLALCSFSLFTLSTSFWIILLINGLFLALWSPAMPLMESLTMQASKLHQFDYGRVRLWGSITFIVGAVGIGYILKRSSPDYIIWAVLMMLVLTCITAVFLPDIKSSRLTKSRFAMTEVLRDRTFVIFLVGTALIQASHALYYGFGSIHWSNAGLGSDVIGLLWAEGVIVEIILFIYGAPILTKFGPSRLIALAGLAGVIRWFGFGMTTELPTLIALQTLHGFTFGAAHLGAMHFIQDRIAPELSATAQSLYSSVVAGIGMGLAMLMSGYLYAIYSGVAYFAMAVLAGIGGIIIFALRRVHV